MVRDRIQFGGEISRTCPDRQWGPPSLLYNGYLVFPGCKSGQGVTLTSPLLVPCPRKSRAIPLIPLRAVLPVQSLSACTRVIFTCTLLYLLVIAYVEKWEHIFLEAPVEITIHCAPTVPKFPRGFLIICSREGCQP